ncbi:hypothetical protein BW716_06340 [[Flexibacter] sp. ATCC 35208]|nr:hypothetical protein BW716_06340 [[Flexibacter] sp. ATCC 35208]
MWKRAVKYKWRRFNNPQLYICYGTNKPVLKKIRKHYNDACTNAYHEINLENILEGAEELNFKEKVWHMAIKAIIGIIIEEDSVGCDCIGKYLVAKNYSGNMKHY